jgi:sortase A
MTLTMPSRRAVLRFLGDVALVAGILLVIEAGITVTWKEPVTAYLASRSQAALEDELDEITSGTLQEAGRTEIGGAIGRIRIPAIDVSFVMVQGTDLETLRKGPGHYVDTQLPGEDGTFAVAGHRTTYLAPFRHIDELARGDRIVIQMPYGKFTYEVLGTEIVAPSAVSVLRPGQGDRVVLTACHPLYSAAKRIVAIGELVGARVERGVGAPASQTTASG